MRNLLRPALVLFLPSFPLLWHSGTFVDEQADELREACPELELVVFTDRDVLEDAPRVAAALETADAFFASLVFDYDNVSVVSVLLLQEYDRHAAAAVAVRGYMLTVRVILILCGWLAL